MSLAIVIASLLQAVAPQAEPSPAPLPSDAIFLHGRARYFSAIVNFRDCRKRFPVRTATLNARFEADRQALAERFGARYFDTPPVDPKSIDAKRACDPGTLSSFETKLAEIEEVLVRSKGQ